MPDNAIFDLHIAHSHAIERAMVGGLTATLGVKRALVECERRQAIARGPCDHSRSELREVRIGEIESFGYHATHFFCVNGLLSKYSRIIGLLGVGL